jgi:predicted ferric reductase
MGYGSGIEMFEMELKATQEETGESRILVKVQGPFDHHTLSVAEESLYQHLLFVAGGIGATAVLPTLTRAFIRRSSEPSVLLLCLDHDVPFGLKLDMNNV